MPTGPTRVHQADLCPQGLPVSRMNVSEWNLAPSQPPCLQPMQRQAHRGKSEVLPSLTGHQWAHRLRGLPADCRGLLDCHCNGLGWARMGKGGRGKEY